MQETKLYFSDFLSKDPHFLKSLLLVDFFPSHALGRKEFLQTIASDGWQLKNDKGRFFVSCQKNAAGLFIKNCLYSVANSMTWHEIVTLIETFARKQFVKSLYWSYEKHSLFSEWMLNHGYQMTDEGLKKDLVYHTGLVLGGGGARGAYQIGVWQALKEMGISFELIVGTSVGALNGCLVLMDDLALAQDLWENIANEKILSYPEAAGQKSSLIKMIQQVRSLTLTALKENGADTRPLAQLLAEKIDEKKMQTATCRLFYCATRIPDLKEMVYQFDQKKEQENLEWLLASASFYPAMRAKRINDSYYVDGGYRNNLPIDVALKNGVTECIAVDVQGPGIDKKVSIPDHVASISLHSPWKLGSFLIFDAKRSTWNISLGYLETLKRFGRYQGVWYTFYNEEDFIHDWQFFLRKLKQTDPELVSFIKQKDFWQKIRKLYQGKVPFEECGRALLEILGKILRIDPTIVYSKKTMVSAIMEKLSDTEKANQGVWSISEWLDFYKNRYFLLSEQNQFFFFYKMIMERKNLQKLNEFRSPMLVLANYFHYIKKEVA